MRMFTIAVVVSGAMVFTACSSTDSSSPISTPQPTPSTSTPSTSTTSTSTTSTSTTSTTSTSTISSTSTTSTTSTTESPGTTQPPVVTTVPAAPTPETVLVYAGGAFSSTWQRLGAWDGTRWLDLDDDVAAAPASIDSVSVASADLPAVVADVGYEFADYACIDGFLHVGIDPDIEIPESALGWGYGAIAVHADWPLQPRPVAAVGLEADVYQAVGEELLAGRPDIDPANGDVVQVLRADLDGDGAEEVLVSFRYLSAPGMGALGDFSIVYVRSIGPDGSVDDAIVFEHIVPPLDPENPFPSPGRGSVAAVADLNGDGVMEVAIRSSYWEYSAVEVFEWREGAMHPILSGGCGV